MYTTGLDEDPTPIFIKTHTHTGHTCPPVSSLPVAEGVLRQCSRHGRKCLQHLTKPRPRCPVHYDHDSAVIPCAQYSTHTHTHTRAHTYMSQRRSPESQFKMEMMEMMEMMDIAQISQFATLWSTRPSFDPLASLRLLRLLPLLYYCHDRLAVPLSNGFPSAGSRCLSQSGP